MTAAEKQQSARNQGEEKSADGYSFFCCVVDSM